MSAGPTQPIPPPAKQPGDDLRFAIRFFAWAAALLGGIWALDHFFR